MRTLKNKWRSNLLALGISFALVAVIVLSVLVSIAFADNDRTPIKETVTTVYKESAKEEKSICPKTKMDSICMTCHTKDWRVKEVPWDAHITYPNTDTKIYKDGDKQHGYYKLTNIKSDVVKKVLDFFADQNINHAIFEVHSFGGSGFEMWRIVGLMNKWKSNGNIIETKSNGIAISAGFVIMASGSKGYRSVNPHAELMWHEVQAMEWPEIGTPSNTEERAKIYRHLQDTAHTYLASVSKMTKEQLDDKVNFREFWMTGKKAVEYGFADGFIKE